MQSTENLFVFPFVKCGKIYMGKSSCKLSKFDSCVLVNDTDRSWFDSDHVGDCQVSLCWQALVLAGIHRRFCQIRGCFIQLHDRHLSKLLARQRLSLRRSQYGVRFFCVLNVFPCSSTCMVLQIDSMSFRQIYFRSIKFTKQRNIMPFIVMIDMSLF